MKDAIYPSLNKVYSAYVIVVGVLAGGFAAYSGVFNSADLVASVMAVGIGLFMAAGSILMVYRASCLRLNDGGVSSGSTAFKWRDVTEVRTVYFGLHLIAGNRKIVIAPYAYRNPDQLFDFVNKALNRAS